MNNVSLSKVIRKQIFELVDYENLIMTKYLIDTINDFLSSYKIENAKFIIVVDREGHGANIFLEATVEKTQEELEEEYSRLKEIRKLDRERKKEIKELQAAKERAEYERLKKKFEGE